MKLRRFAYLLGLIWVAWCIFIGMLLSLTEPWNLTGLLLTLYVAIFFLLSIVIAYYWPRWGQYLLIAEGLVLGGIYTYNNPEFWSMPASNIIPLSLILPPIISGVLLYVSSSKRRIKSS